MNQMNNLTPSEIVLLHGEQFATKGGRTTLLDGTTRVESKALLRAMVRAALLAHEQAGTLRLEIAEQKTAGRRPSARLFVVPTGKAADWPAPSLESRLFFKERAEVSAILADWLWVGRRPWDWAVEQVKIPMALRGVVTVKAERSGPTYTLAEDAASLIAREPVAPVRDLLEACEHERPQVWNLLEKEINKAIRRSIRPGRGSPWLAEAEKDWKPLAEKLPEVKPTWGPAVIGGILLILFVASLWGRWMALALITAGIVLVAGYQHVFKTMSAQQHLDRLVEALAGYQKLAQKVKASFRMITILGLVDTLVGALIGYPLLALLMSLIYLWMGWARPLTIVLVASGLLFFVLSILAGSAINKQVKGPPPDLPSNDEDEEVEKAAVLESADALPGEAIVETVRQPESAGRPFPFSIEIVEPDTLPPLSAQSRTRLEVIRERGPQVRRIYRRAIAGLAVSITLMAVLLTVFVQTNRPLPRLLFLGGTLLLSLGSVALLLKDRAGKPFRVGLLGKAWMPHEGEAGRDRRRWEDEVVAIRPGVVPLLGRLWLVAALIGALIYAWVSSVGSLVLVLALGLGSSYVLWLQRHTTALEKRYPLHPPLNLLALRVFGSPSLDDFMELTVRWQWLGTFQRLDGPGTAGKKAKDIKLFVTGRIDEAIVKSTAALETSLAGFNTSANEQLRYALNSIQCTNATWQQALQRLLDKADVVVMDLSQFSETNRGCVHEIGKLFDQIPFRRIVLLVDDATDLAFLKTIFRQVWHAMAPASPNRATDEPLRLYHSGGSMTRLPTESVYAWRCRLAKLPDEERFVGALYDAALSARPATYLEKEGQPTVVPWGRSALPLWLRFLLNTISVILFLLVLITLV